MTSLSFIVIWKAKLLSRKFTVDYLALPWILAAAWGSLSSKIANENLGWNKYTKKMKKDETDTFLNRKGLRWLFKWELFLGSEDLILFAAFQSLNAEDECWWKKLPLILLVTSSCQIEKVIERVKRWWGEACIWPIFTVPLTVFHMKITEI